MNFLGYILSLYETEQKKAHHEGKGASMEIVRDWKKEKERRKLNKQQKVVRKQIKKQNDKRRYQKELLRKPNLLREMIKALPVFLIVTLLADFVFAALGASSYVQYGQDQMEYTKNLAVDFVSKAQTKYGDDLDFNQVKMEDGLAVAQTGDEDTDHRLNKAITFLDSYVGGHQRMSVWDYRNLFFRTIYSMYLIQREKEEFYSYTNAPYDMVIFNQNGEEIAGNGKDVFLMLNYKEEVMDISIHSTLNRVDIARIEKTYPGFYDKLVEYGETCAKVKGYMEIRGYDYHISDCFVIPERVEIIGTPSIARKKGGLYDKDRNDLMLIEEFDLSKCDFTGYEKIDAESLNDTFPMLLQLTDWRENVHSKYLDYYRYNDNEGDHFKVVLQNYPDNMRFTGTINNNMDFGNYKSIEVMSVPNSTLLAVVAVDYDFFRDWKPILVNVYSLSLIIMAALLFLYALFRYQKKKVSYEVEAYRRRTTNAMAHDLKSPLMAISGYAENIRESGEGEKSLKYGENILLTVQDMDKMISNILELSKLENYEMTLKKETIPLEDLIKEKLGNYEERLKERGLSVQINGAAKVNADREWLGHLIDNLLSNAGKYAKEGSEIRIKMDERALVMENDYDYELSIKGDDLLEPFIKGDKARSNTEGNGLGLSIVQSIASAHGFYFKVQAEEGKFKAELNFNKRV